MSITVDGSKKRSWQGLPTEETVESITEQLSSVDQLTSQKARRLFLETDPNLLQEGMNAHLTGNLRSLHSIHSAVESVCDPLKRHDRLILRTFKQIPDVLSVGEVLSDHDLRILQTYLLRQDLCEFEAGNGRKGLLRYDAKCQIGFNGSFDVNDLYNYSKQDSDPAINWIITKLFRKAMEAAYQIDGSKSVRNYHARLFVIHDPKEKYYPLKWLEMHHDYRYTTYGVPEAYPKYLYLSMISDSKGKLGWEGGDLIIQNDNCRRRSTSTNPCATFRPNCPYVRYNYPVNEGICLRNRIVFHQRTSTVAKESGIIDRKLLIVQLFEE
jgi:hypothetical protein